MQNDEAYANAAYIPGGDTFPAKWEAAARAFRETARLEELRYGPGEREVLDLFLPEGDPKGLMVFVHGGYWLRFGRKDWSHLAAGGLARGYAVALPSYTLCPDIRIAGITRQIETAIATASARISGPIRLTGHSAGGHLSARMACDDLTPAWRGRLMNVVPISAIADLAPLTLTSMNADLRIDRAEALSESPLLQKPVVPAAVWVGGDERPAFLGQAEALGQSWGCPVIVEPGKHHFDVIDGLADPNAPLCREIFQA